MLGRLNEFLFGAGEAGSVAAGGTQASQQPELETSEGDMGWEIVDVSGSESVTTQLSSSPLENLLIEHPSMSVYQSLEERPAAEEESGRPQEMGVVGGGRAAGLSARATRSSVSVAQQVKLTRSHQRKQQVESRKKLSSKNIERTNKARLVQSTCGKQLSAFNRTLRPSGRMNGRRSQRAF